MKPGKTNTKADALSRRSDHQVVDAEDNNEVQVLKPLHFRAAATRTLIDRDDLTERIRKGVTREASVLEAMEKLRKDGPHKLTDGTLEWEERDGLVYYKGRLYIPADEGLRQAVVEQCHDAPTAGHPGRDGTIELVSRLYWWPTLAQFVTRYVAGCDPCQRRKAGLHPPAPTQPLDVPEGPWQTVGVDLVTGLPDSDGYDAICTIVDHYTHVVHAIPCRSTIDAEGIAGLYIREIFRLHGVPARIVSDRGPQFAARIMKEFLRLLGINSNLTTAYHPQANGMTERMNAEVVKYLRLFCDARQDDWARLLPMAEFVINSREVAALHNTPFEVQYGYRPNFTVPAGRAPLFPSIDQRLEHLREARKEAEAAMRLAKERLQRDNEIRARRLHNFEPGDKVWLDAKDIKVHQKSRKLGPKRLGPFTVVKKHGDLDYELELPPSLKVHRVFHVDRLSPWKGNEVNGVNPPPPEPIEIDEEEEYEVDGVLDSRFYRRQLQYLVSFKGYDAGHNMWLPHFNVHAPELIEAFHREHAEAPRRLSATLFWTLPWSTVENATVASTDLEWESGRRPGRC
jgi:transposase InsO family protein